MFWRIVRPLVFALIGVGGGGLVLFKPMAIMPVDRVRAIYNKEDPLTVFESAGQTVVVAHAVEEAGTLKGPEQYHSPQRLCEELLQRGDLVPDEDVLVVCCHPGQFESGEFASIRYRFVGTTRNPLVLFWCVRWLVVTESRFGF